MFKIIKFNMTVMALAILLLVLPVAVDVLADIVIKDLPACGTINAPPFADPRDAGSRSCPEPATRNYVPRYSGLAYDILAIESDACFIPDEFYRLLDSIVSDVKSALNSLIVAFSAPITRDLARHISKTIGDVLATRNFALYIPTETIGDALEFRNKVGEPERHIMDCDTGSLIYLTLAENLRLPLSLVEITLPSGAGHNYVRWQLADGTVLDWDTNGRSECMTPANLAPFEGKSMSRDQVMGYVYGIRGDLRGRRRQYTHAIEDFRKSISLYPESPKSSNNLAWMVATKDFPERGNLGSEALAEAKRAVGIQRNANHLDTLACVFAALGDFSSAVVTATEAVRLNAKPEFRERLERLKAKQDCKGLE
jgi:hypothetical protein